MLMTPLIKPRLRNTLRQDSRAARIVGCIVADAALNLKHLRGNEARATLGPLLLTSAKPSCENTCPQNVNALLTAKRNRPAILVVAQNFQFNHRLPALMTQG